MTRVAFVTLGCGRNEVDTDQVAGALQASGFTLVDDAAEADCVLVNTCAFIEPARQESVDAVLEACDLRRDDGSAPAVLVMGCMAQRYGDELAEAIPEAAGVIGFADYARLPQIVTAAAGGGDPSRQTGAQGTGDPSRDAGARLKGDPSRDAGARLEGDPSRGAGARLKGGPGARRHPSGSPDLPLPLVSPSGLPLTVLSTPTPPTASFPVRTQPRGPWAYLRIAGGCDRTCTFCAIPSFRGRFVSRPADEVLAEAAWLAGQGVRELVCVSENTTSWGKDLPGGRAGIVDLIRGFERIEGIERVRLMYLQPAEITEALLDVMAESPVVAGYYDLSLQHASGEVLRRMSRKGDAERFARLIAGIRRRDPAAVFRSSFILGFPGETERDVEILADFLEEVSLDWAGFFTFSVEEGTPSATMPDQVPYEEAAARRDELVQRYEAIAEERTLAFVGRTVDVLVEEVEDGTAIGRSYREAPETDGEVRLAGPGIPVGRVVPVRITGAVGVDLEGVPVTTGGRALGAAVAG